MKKTKITYICAMIVIFISGICLSGYGEEMMYGGVGFESIIGPYLFSALSFICFTIVEKNNPLSMFADGNLARMMHIHSRRKAVTFDIVRIFITVFVLQVCEVVAILTGSLLWQKSLSVSVLIQYFLMNYVIRLLLIYVQYFLELNIAYNFAFIAIFLVYVAGLFAGMHLYEKIMEESDIHKQNLYKFINKCDFLNYTSVPRTRELVGNCITPVGIIILLIILVLVIIKIYVKHIDLLKKD